jgi:hypothetical protein
MSGPVNRARTSIAAASLLLAVAVVSGTACYEYQAADASAVRATEVVHVVLSPEAAVALKADIGANASTLDGRVVWVDSDRVRLAVRQIGRSIGPEEFLSGEELDLPLAGASSISVRRFDRARSLLAAGGIIASALAAGSFANQPAITTIRGGTGATTR